MSFDIPLVGNLAICLTLISAAYTFAMALGAARGRPQLLGAARWGAYATIAFITLSVCLLGYAFQTHDFRITYVARYSDRTMPWYYLVTSLWGGQDGSLLWWNFLLGGYTFAVVRWLKGRHIQLQPIVIATLMATIGFFAIVQLFAANPFSTSIGAPPADGEGLNPLLQNYWMVIHPPSLYMGFVGWAVPFAFAIAALVTKRLDTEWIHAARLWAMIAWTFLSIGLLLGCAWSYDELGWGGYWAWDPVENASFMPWLIGTAYLHSAIVQERYSMLKIWNFFLMCLTFFMTIYGTFLTRSGMIASVHSFARSDIGIYFVYFMVVIFVVSLVLIAWRLPQLQATRGIYSLASREFMFLLNNWILLGMMIFVWVATAWPLISDYFLGEEATVGPSFYNQWMVPFGIMLLILMGVGPLISWRKATGEKLRKAFLVPAITAIVVMTLHLLLGDLIGFPAIVEAPVSVARGAAGALLSAIRQGSALASSTACAFVMATILQEFWRGTRVRMKKGEPALTALVNLVSRAKRRYGGYIVHFGIVVMYLGFTGAAYDEEAEAALHPGEGFDVHGYEVRYERPIFGADVNKSMFFAELSLLDEGDAFASAYPAKFIYETHPDMPTTEVSIRSNAREDIYMILSTVDSNTQRATIRVMVRPLVLWIWIGGFFVIAGSLLSMFPSGKNLLGERRRREQRKRRVGAPTTLIAILIALAALLSSHQALAQGTSSAHAGSITLEDPQERALFSQLMCMCGDCQRLALDTCGCGWAVDRRAELRLDLERGMTPDEIIASYEALYGAAALATPPDEGARRLIWIAPVLAVFAFGAVMIGVGRRWRRRAMLAAPPGGESSEEEASAGSGEATGQELDAAIDEALERMDS